MMSEQPNMEEVDMEKVEAAVLRLDRIEAILLQIEANGREALTRTAQQPEQLAGSGHVVESVTEPRLQLSDSEKPRRVFLRCNILSIDHVDTTERHFRAEAYVTARWKEPQLDGIDDDDIHWDDYWDPKIMFPNVAQLERCVKSYSVMHDPNDIVPQVIQGFHVSGNFRMTPNFDNFPFDVHPLTVQVTSEHSAEDVVFVKDMKWWDTVSLHKFGAKDCWSLQQPLLPDTSADSQTSIDMETTAPKRPVFSFRTNIKRKALFYCLSMFLVVFLIFVFTFCTFALNPEPRITLLAILLILLFLLKLVYKESMPASVRFNNVDKYILGCVAFQIVMAIESAISSSLSESGSRGYDIAWGLIFMFLVCAAHGFFIFFIVQKVQRRNQTLRDQQKEYIGISDEIQASQGERHHIIEVKKKKRFSKKHLQESFRRLFSDSENADESTATTTTADGTTADGEKTPRRRFPKIKMPQMPRRRPKAESTPKKAEEEKVEVAGETEAAAPPPRPRPPSKEKAIEPIEKLEDFELDSSDDENVPLNKPTATSTPAKTEM